jgi:DNA-binding LacI/PurR family transcriptional regulator
MTEDGGSQACRQLLENTRRPTAIFAANDMLAVGALTTADSLGLRVPGQLSIVGYDNTSIAGIGRIALTTVDNVSYEIGVRGAERLKLRLHGEAGPPVTEVLPPRLVLRSSTAWAELP